MGILGKKKREIIVNEKTETYLWGVSVFLCYSKNSPCFVKDGRLFDIRNSCVGMESLLTTNKNIWDPKWAIIV